MPIRGRASPWPVHGSGKLGPEFAQDENPYDFVFFDLNVWLALSVADRSDLPASGAIPS